MKDYLNAFNSRNDVESTTIDMADLVKDLKANVDSAKDEGKSFFMYEGSLTTPPCSEGVAWTVMKSPLQISSEQLKEIESYTKGQFK